MPSDRPSYYDPMQITMSEEMIDVDVCIYGGTAAGVAAALQVARMGHTVVVLEPSEHLGGMTASGWSWGEVTDRQRIGGIAQEFVKAVANRTGVENGWTAEPHVAEKIFDDWLAQATVPVRFRQFAHEVQVSGRAITHLLLEGGRQVRARMFIDCSDEGDLMALAQVSCTWEREGNDVYGETLNGVQTKGPHQFEFPVDPYVIPGQAASGLLAGVASTTLAAVGSGDPALPASAFRLCLTRSANQRIPFAKPEDYDSQWYELHVRYFATGWNDVFRAFQPIHGDKTDAGNHGATSMDFIGQNHGWPAGTYGQREQIFQRHVQYQQGLMWFLANDARVPDKIRKPMAQWGLAKDEFIATGGWPHRLLLRAGRRLVGEYVMSEHDCLGTRLATDVVGMAAGALSSHHCQRVVVAGRVQNEGGVHQPCAKPFPLSYRALIPRNGSLQNLLVPVCLSASHIAYGAIRSEPLTMILAQSAATAACHLIDAGKGVHDLDYGTLRERLKRDGQVLG